MQARVCRSSPEALSLNHLKEEGRSADVPCEDSFEPWAAYAAAVQLPVKEPQSTQGKAIPFLRCII